MSAKPPSVEAVADQPATTKTAGAADGPAINSHELFHGAREVIIVHGKEEYRLRITRQDKLILTK